MGVADDDMIEDASDVEAKRLNEMKEKGNTSFILYCICSSLFSLPPSLPLSRGRGKKDVVSSCTAWSTKTL